MSGDKAPSGVSQVSSKNQEIGSDEQQQPEPHEEAGSGDRLASLSQARKNMLLFTFSIATFVDVCNVAGTAIAVAQIASDIHLGSSQVVWIITSYSICFAAFLLFAGRISDIFPASIVFEGGFFVLGVLSLVVSFVTSNKYGFLILRGLGGIAGSMTIPSAYHLTVRLFPDHKEQQAKLALLAMTGAIGNVLGLVLAGICMLANYKWFFRVLAIICLVFTAICFLLLPLTDTVKHHSYGISTWKKLDLVGVGLLAAALICFILSLTQGPIDGWGSASFIAPFVLSFPIAIAFFFWESHIPQKTAVLPSSVWKISNIVIMSLALGIAFPFWSTSQIMYSTYFQEVTHWTPIKVAASMLPQGITGLIVGGASQAIPQIITKPRITLPLGSLLIIGAEILQIFSNGGHGLDYWKFCFPAFILGSAGAILCYICTSVNLITYCPPEMAGVAGALVQVVAQVAAAVTLAVQASFEGDGVQDWNKAARRSFYFQIAWTAVLCIQFVVFFRKPTSPQEAHEATRRRIAESGKDVGV
ncbi:hypothetical protein L202_00613 [Cryptococcus amylolentus CBS 6039]|uniref:Major facilitator superfamily (MFS) profile domain-containing protein n=1 Tax=Cryptococcus amylolentus CBS 6039 TaxID=1295533 RepID=A0A1E3I7V6_9TREE|nr:hypothetical protein L202_00613 [Cryptococcus amylolentus CBS 6039]ODN84729.1 hypothetical protein L202_00613 [Cryptococcus amylolentus CBS 6039]